MQKHNLPSLSIIALSSIVALSSLTSIDTSAQQIYQWKDEKGRVHFGERPPRDKTSEKVDIKVPKYLNSDRASSSVKSSKQTAKKEGSEDKTSGPPVNEERMKKREADYKRNCNNAKQLLAQMNSPENTRFTMPDGSTRTMPAEERKKQIAAAKASIEFYCK